MSGWATGWSSTAEVRSPSGGQDQRSVGGDRHGVLGMRTARPVPAAQGPAVLVGVDLVGVLQEPRLDGDHQARAQRQPATPATVVRDVRIAVHGPSDAVATELGVDLVTGLS